VRVVVQDTDRYGRTVGQVFAGSADANAEMDRQGIFLRVLRVELYARTEGASK
jgi:endonuclease YncB( thermonuclease family)